MLELQALGKRFGAVEAVRELSLEVPAGELLSLLGPSGCGKTTTLRMVAGFEAPTSGQVRIGGRDVTALPPQRRGVGMVFQNYALFPHLDVAQNVAFGLEARGTPRGELRRRVGEALERVDLAGYTARKVQELSGGQQQRVALARALAPEPPVLLLDEPLSNLDTVLRERTRTELRALLKRIGITSIFVTHDQEEAFALSDRVAVMYAGRLQQVGTPEQLYHEPANALVMGFIGQSNALPVHVVHADGDGLLCELPGGARWRAGAPRDAARAPAAGDALRLMVRPEALRLRRADATYGTDAEAGQGADAGRAAELAAVVASRRFAGALVQYRLAAEGLPELLVTVPAAHDGDAAVAEGERVRVRPASGARLHAFAEHTP